MEQGDEGEVKTFEQSREISGWEWKSRGSVTDEK